MLNNKVILTPIEKIKVEGGDIIKNIKAGDLGYKNFKEKERRSFFFFLPSEIPYKNQRAFLKKRESRERKRERERDSGAQRKNGCVLRTCRRFYSSRRVLKRVILSNPSL